jgi:hypothetical protein
VRAATKSPRASVAARSYDHADRLPEVLERARAQTWPDYDERLVRRLCARYPHVSESEQLIVFDLR